MLALFFILFGSVFAAPSPAPVCIMQDVIAAFESTFGSESVAREICHWGTFNHQTDFGKGKWCDCMAALSEQFKIEHMNCRYTDAHKKTLHELGDECPKRVCDHEEIIDSFIVEHVGTVAEEICKWGEMQRWTPSGYDDWCDCMAVVHDNWRIEHLNCYWDDHHKQTWAQLAKKCPKRVCDVPDIIASFEVEHAGTVAEEICDWGNMRRDEVGGYEHWCDCMAVVKHEWRREHLNCFYSSDHHQTWAELARHCPKRHCDMDEILTSFELAHKDTLAEEICDWGNMNRWLPDGYDRWCDCMISVDDEWRREHLNCFWSDENLQTWRQLAAICPRRICDADDIIKSFNEVHPPASYARQICQWGTFGRPEGRDAWCDCMGHSDENWKLRHLNCFWSHEHKKTWGELAYTCPNKVCDPTSILESLIETHGWQSKARMACQQALEGVGEWCGCWNVAEYDWVEAHADCYISKGSSQTWGDLMGSCPPPCDISQIRSAYRAEFRGTSIFTNDCDKKMPRKTNCPCVTAVSANSNFIEDNTHCYWSSNNARTWNELLQPCFPPRRLLEAENRFDI